MKLKSLKFVLPILLVLPSLAFASLTYHRMPEETEITSPVDIYLKFDNWDLDICNGVPLCIDFGRYWQLVLYTPAPDLFPYYGEIHDKTIEETMESFDLPVGTQVGTIYVIALDDNQLQLPAGSILEQGFPAFTIIETPPPPPPPSPPSGTIGNTQNWLSSNEILGYIGKLTEDIPNYIALIIGLPISFWFIEKIIAFVRGNFRSAEKIKEE
jgi:hypothetical protein